MAAGCNQVITVSGGSGATSVQTITYNQTTNEMTFTKADGTATTIKIRDVKLTSAGMLPGTTIMRYVVGDIGSGYPTTNLDVDFKNFINHEFASQGEVNAGVLTDKMISPETLAEWLRTYAKASAPTPANAGKIPYLGADGKLDASWINHLAVTEVHVAADKAALDALIPGGTVGKGDVGVATNDNKSYIFNGTAWVELLTPTDSVLSVNSKTGTVLLGTDDIPETADNMYLKPGVLQGDVLSWDNVDKKWKSISTHNVEVGGKAFKPNVHYEAGDIVDHGGHIYSRRSAGQEATWDLTRWERTDSAGTIHSDASTYRTGDMVSYLGDIYVAKVDVSTPKPFDNADWDNIAGPNSPFNEKGGIPFDVNLSYGIGDIVTYSGSAYMSNKVLTPGSFNPADWDEIGVHNAERGGLLFTSTNTYKVGDIVSHGNNVFVALSNNGPANFDPASWKNINTLFIEKGGIPFDSSFSYVIGDIVSHGGSVYVANKVIAPGTFTDTDWDELAMSSDIIDTFTGLNDTPDNYTGVAAGDIVSVNSTTDGLVFTNTIDGGTY